MQPDGDLPHLYHYTNGAWTDITSYQDPGKICGLTSSFSPFALGVPEVVDTPDTTPPTVTGVATRSPNSRGWYRSDVRIDWTATDDGSGVAAQPADTVVTGQGANLTAQSPEVCDTAPTPNCTHGTVTGLKIDRTAPALAVRGVADGATYTLGAAPTPTCSASDQLSGLAAPCQGSRSGGNANGVGPFTYTAAVSDRAGNTRTVTAHYRVVYRFDGFQAPINAPSAPLSIFRAGSTISAGITVKRANGEAINPVSRPVWVTPVRGARTSAPVNEAVSRATGSTGTAFTWKNNRWQYDWSTNGVAPGYVYRIGVRLDDGITHYVNVGVR